MSEDCNHNCQSCNQDCDERTKESLLVKPHEYSVIQKVIGVVSGQGRRRQKPGHLPACRTGPQARLENRYSGRRYHRSIHPQGIRPARTRRGYQ